MADPQTIRALIQATAPWLKQRGADNGRTEAELLVGHALSMRRLDLYLDLERPLSNDEVTRCRALVKRRGQGEPLAYITGEREFYGLSLHVSPDVLIPRADTETLVEASLAWPATTVKRVAVFIAAAAGLLHEQGRVLLEIGADQGEAARSLLLPGFAHIEVKADLAGHPRVVVLAR